MPTVAAVQGHVFAAGAMFALSHDVRVMRADRGFFCLPEVDIRIPFSTGMSALVQGRLVKQVAHEAPTSWSGLWPLLVMVVVGGCSIVSAQSAYQAGHLIESLPPLTVLEPVVAAAIASYTFGEALAPGFWAHTGQLLGILLLAGGVVDLARRPAPVLEEIPIPVPP